MTIQFLSPNPEERKALDELEKLINQKKAKYAKPALEILQEKGIKILKTRKKGSVDDILTQLKGYAIATADKKLKNKIKNKKIFTIRQKKYIKCFTN